MNNHHTKYRHILFFFFFTFLFLFYPGDSFYYHIFAYHRNTFKPKPTPSSISLLPIPYSKNIYPLTLTAEGAYIVDLPSFTPVYEKNSRQAFLPASTAKIITALVAYDLYNPDKVVTVKRVFQEGQIMNLVEGEQITLENLLYGILVHSANDAAITIADSVGYQKFLDLMNEKAKKLHMRNSHFKNPAGLDEAGQQTTPFDLALAARALLKNKYLARFVATKEIIISDVNYQYFHKLTNVNKLLGEIHGIGGLKTGYTENAGENLVSFYKKNGHEFIIVILKSLDRFEDTRNTVLWIDANIDYITPISL